MHKWLRKLRFELGVKISHLDKIKTKTRIFSLNFLPFPKHILKQHLESQYYVDFKNGLKLNFHTKIMEKIKSWVRCKNLTFRWKSKKNNKSNLIFVPFSNLNFLEIIFGKPFSMYMSKMVEHLLFHEDVLEKIKSWVRHKNPELRWRIKIYF